MWGLGCTLGSAADFGPRVPETLRQTRLSLQGRFFSHPSTRAQGWSQTKLCTGHILVMILGRFLRKEESEGGRRAREEESPQRKVLSPRPKWKSRER